MLGCHCGSKWNAAERVDEAVSASAEFVTEARVDELLVDSNGHRSIGGVRGRHRNRPFEIRAGTVILSAGGIGSPLLLRQAGLAGAGRGIAMDTTVIVIGACRVAGNGEEPPMTYGWENLADGYMLSTLVDPWLMYPIITALRGWPYPLTRPRWGHTLGVMVKLKDDTTGEVVSERDISKPFTEADQTRLDCATDVARRILVQGGADPGSLFVTPARGTHPCASVRIGDMLDTNLETEIDNLYVCDAKAFPQALARPTVLTILALGQGLVDYLTTRKTQKRDAA
jgi:choline dehydrogenase-like flavoprotein